VLCSCRGLLEKYENGSKIVHISNFKYGRESRIQWIQDKVTFDVLTAVFMSIQVFWDVTPC
jgi:hypothetical protein